MSDPILDTIALLENGTESEMTTAATRLGLLLERASAAVVLAASGMSMHSSATLLT